MFKIFKMIWGDLINMKDLEKKRFNLHRAAQLRGTSIHGHFASSPFLFAPSFHDLLLSFFTPPPALSISLFLSVKVMQLIFLCLFIFQDWLWNVGSRQKPHRPLLSIRLLHPPLFPLLTTGAHHFPKPRKQDRMWRNATPQTLSPALLSPHAPCPSSSSVSIPSSFVPSPPLSPSSPFKLAIWPHSTNRIKVMHHT